MFTDTCRFFFTIIFMSGRCEAGCLERRCCLMFQIGEYIVYGRSGICQIEDITHLEIAGADEKRLYYVLVPLNIKGSRVYFPVDKKDANARKVITRQEAMALLDEIPKIQEMGVSNEKLREESYKQALNSCDYRQWVAVLKTLHQRRRVRTAQGKKMGATDERYLKMTEDALYSELAFVMGKKKAEMEPFIIRYMNEKENTKTEKTGVLP